MRSLILASLSLTLAATATAQTPNYFDMWSGCTNYTSRGALGTNAGDNLLEVPASHFSGVGHDATGTGTVLTGFRHVLQDQNAATGESYSFVVRGDASGQPDCTAAGLLLQTAPLAAPTGVGTLAWIITATLATPSTALPLCNTYYHGLNLPANAGWTADGLSSHMSSYYVIGATQADNPAPNAHNLAWNCLAGAPTQPTSSRVIRYELALNAAVLRLGNTDPTLIGNAANCVSTLLNSFGNPRSFGAGGLYPELGGGRNDGIDYRINDAANQSGFYVVFIGANIGCPGLPLGFLYNGGLHLNPTALTSVASGGLDTTGLAIGTILPPNSAPNSIVNRVLDFQAFTVGPALTLPGNLTNRHGIQYLP